MNTIPCHVCNTLGRYKSGKCKKCVSIRCKKYALNNKDKIKENRKLYYLLNKEKIKNRVKVWSENNKERIKIRSKEYHANNKETLNKKSSEYRKNNPEKIKKTIQRWCDKNRERLNKKKNEWVKVNKEKVKEIKNNNRTKRMMVKGKLSAGIFNRLMELQKRKCIYCSSVLESNGKTHIDHIIPIALGGENIDDNVQLLCQSCNLRKNAKHPVAFAKEMGFLL